MDWRAAALDSQTITDQDRKNIKIARELKALTKMPGWKHLETIIEKVSLKKYIGPEELKTMLSDNLLAYNIGKKDGITEFFNIITLTIAQGGQMVNNIQDRQESARKKIQDIQELNDKHGYN
jgi:hypothetical protein